MAGDILALSHTATVGLPTPTGLMWFLLILAAAAGARYGWLVPIGIFVLYLVMHSGSRHGNFSVALLPWILIGLACGFIGWQLGGRAILRHLGEAEFLGRLTNAKRISSVWTRWFG